MPWLYGDGTPIRQPAWVTGRETPTQRDRRLLDIDEVLKKKEKRDQEERNRELLRQLDQQEDLKFSPPSPPRGPDTPADLETEIGRSIRFQDRYEGLLDSRFESYGDRFGFSPLFGSEAYVSAERLAFEDLRDSMSNKPGSEFDDLVGYETVLKTFETSSLITNSRSSRVDRDRIPAVDSKYDILVSGIKADVGQDEAVDTWIAGIERDIHRENPGLDDQGIREQLYRTLRIQELLSEVLDEWNWPRDKPTAGVTATPPLSAIDEALRREEEENGEFFKDFPDRPGLIEKIGSVFTEKFIPTTALKSLPFTALPLQLSSLADQEFLSLDDIHVIGQETSADPIAGFVLRGEIPIVEPGGPGGLRFGAVETGQFTGLAGGARQIEAALGATGIVETDVVSTALRSQLAEDILSEAISPEFIAIALPFAGVGTATLKGAPKLLRIVANLTVGTDVGAARGFPLLRPATLRSVFRGLTAVARSPLAIRSIPTAIRNNPTFQAGLNNLRRAQAYATGRVPGADDPLRFRRVLKDLIDQTPSSPENLPLRQAIESDLSTGRSVPDLIENGLSTPGGRPLGGGEGELGAFWRGEVVGGRGPRIDNMERNLFRAFEEGEPLSHSSLQRVARETNLVAPELVEQATSLELVELLQARRVATGLGSRTPSSLKKAELLEIATNAALGVGDKPTRGSLLKAVTAAAKREKSVPEAITSRLWESLSEADIATVFRLTAEGAVDPGTLVTQLVSGKSADTLNRARIAAFESSRSLGQREKSLNTYLEGLQKIIDRSTSGSVKRMSLERDLRTTRWAWEVKYGVKPLEVAQEELRESFRILTAEHRGTNAERLAKLTTERANQITEEIESLLSRFPKLSKTQKDRFAKRLTTEALDSELGGEIYDAGRQLEAMFQIAGVDRKVANQAYEALAILTTRGATPTSQQITAMRRALDPVLGKGATSQLLNARKLTTKAGELVLNSIGLPRALMASSDISALGRQAGIIGPRMPIQWVKMAGRSIRAFWQPEYADEVRRSVINSGVIRLQGGETVDIYQYATKEANLFLASDAGQLGLTFKEEEYMTSFASKWGWNLPRDAKGRFSLNPTQWEKVPFPVPLAQSERAYVTGLDKIRMDYFANEMKHLVQRGMANGRPAKLENFKQLALFTNNATGRGKMFEFLRSSTPILNALFFAPRLVLSRFAILGDVARFTVKGGPMRRVVWETLAADAIAFSATAFMIKTALDAANLDSDVSFNWTTPIKQGEDGVWRRDSDFLKIRVGESRIDFLASMGPVQRLMVGLGVAAYQGDGEMAAQIAESFVRSKEAPVTSGVHDVISGEDFVGGKVELTVDELLTDVILSRIIPLSWQSPVEAIAASRGEIDIDIGDAIADVVTNFPNRDETITAGAVLSAEMAGGGVTSFFNPGERLRENEEELLQTLIDGGQIESTDGQEISKVDDLNAIQAKVLKEAYTSEERKLADQQLEQGLWRDSEWATSKVAEEKFHEELSLTGGYTNPDTGKWESLFGPGGSWRYSEIDAQLLTGTLSGSDWIFRDSQNISAVINVRRALFGREEEDIEDIENPTDRLIAEYWEIDPIDHLLPGGGYDQEGFQEARDAKKAEISAMVGDPVAVKEYFDSFSTKRDTKVQTRAKAAKEEKEVFDETPVYMAGITDTTVNNLLDDIGDYLDSVGSRWGRGRYIQWLYYQGEQYQTNEMAVAYWVAVGERDQVLSREREQQVQKNPDLVLFYPGVFSEISGDSKQLFVDEHGTGLFSNEFLADLRESGEISTQGDQQLFRPRPVFQP